MKTKAFPRPDWELVLHPSIQGVERQVWLVDKRVVLARLRFGPHTQSHLHAVDHDIHVVCLEGAGFARSGDSVDQIHAGETVLWPKGEDHNLFTEEEPMTTLLVEHVFQRRS